MDHVGKMPDLPIISGKTNLMLTYKKGSYPELRLSYAIGALMATGLDGCALGTYEPAAG